MLDVAASALSSRGVSVGLTENGTTALPLVADDATHGDCLERESISIVVGDGRINGGGWRTLV